MRLHRLVRKIGSYACAAIGVDDFTWLDSTGESVNVILEGEFDTHVKGSSQYSENIVAMMLMTIPSFVSSVAVTSIQTLRVFKVILLWSELMMGGMEATLR